MEHHPGGAKTFVFSVNIFKRKRSDRNSIMHQGTLERSHRRMAIGLQQRAIANHLAQPLLTTARLLMGCRSSLRSLVLLCRKPTPFLDRRYRCCSLSLWLGTW